MISLLTNIFFYQQVNYLVDYLGFIASTCNLIFAFYSICNSSSYSQSSSILYPIHVSSGDLSVWVPCACGLLFMF
jgi:hypothetical protein